MPPRKKFSGSSLSQLLKKYDFVSVRQKGSHLVLQKKTEQETITVIVPMHKDLKPGTVGSVIRQSKLDKSLFE